MKQNQLYMMQNKLVTMRKTFELFCLNVNFAYCQKGQELSSPTRIFLLPSIFPVSQKQTH